MTFMMFPHGHTSGSSPSPSCCGRSQASSSSKPGKLARAQALAAIHSCLKTPTPASMYRRLSPKWSKAHAPGIRPSQINTWVHTEGLREECNYEQCLAPAMTVRAHAWQRLSHDTYPPNHCSVGALKLDNTFINTNIFCKHLDDRHMVDF